MYDPAKIISRWCVFAKPEVEYEVQCSRCGERIAVQKHGFYERYSDLDQTRIPVQRYKCLNPECPNVTFSILPFPLLPWLRHRLCFLFWLADAIIRGQSIRKLSRDLKRSRKVIQRALPHALKLNRWFSLEWAYERWGPDPCKHPERKWTAFTQSCSWALFPDLAPR